MEPGRSIATGSLSSVTSLREVEFYYCCSCPASYLALVRVREAVLRTHARLVFRPIVSEWLEDGDGDVGPFSRHSSNPAVTAYLRKNLADWASFCGVEIDPDYRQPVRSEWAQRVAVAAIDAGCIANYADATFKALFTEGRDISSREVVTDVALRCGMSPTTVDLALQAGHTEAIVRRNMAALLKRGGFGTPTLFVGDDMYFGHEQVPLLELALMASLD